MVCTQALDTEVEIEEEGAFAVVANHALYPKKGTESAAFGYGGDVMEAGGGVEDHVTCGKLYFFCAVGVFDAEFAAFIFVGFGEEKCGGKVCADLLLGAGDYADGAVDVGAEGLATCIAVEHGGKYVQGNGGGEEELVGAEGAENCVANLLGDGVLGKELGVVFDAGALVACGGFAVYPVASFEELAGLGDLLCCEYIRNT